jgi:hypothetical protein
MLRSIALIRVVWSRSKYAGINREGENLNEEALTSHILNYTQAHTSSLSGSVEILQPYHAEINSIGNDLIV